VLLGGAGLARVVPIVALVVPLFLLFRAASGSRQAAIRTARTLAVAAGMLVICGAWFYAGSGRFALSDSAGLHLYNRVVEEQGLIDLQGPATAAFVELYGSVPRRGIPHWDVVPVLGQHGLSYPEAEALMGQVAMEGLRSDPVAFFRYSARLSLRSYAAVPSMAAWAAATAPIAALESPVPVRLRVPSTQWWTVSQGAFRRLWSVLLWLPVLGLALLPFVRERLVFLAVLAIPAGYLFTTAQLEQFVPRYVVGVLPFALMLSTVPLAVPGWFIRSRQIA
jgi:hypothetical protein